MLKFKPFLFFTFILILHLDSYSQCPFDTKFGKIKPADFSYKSSFVDSNSTESAIVLFMIGNAEFESNNRGGIRMIFNEHARIKIVNKSGVDAATVKNRLLKINKEYQEEITNLKASTFNLENNLVNEYKLEKKGLVSTKITGDYYEDVFTLPQVSEGSIIEYSYTITSEFYNKLHPWYFQGANPIVYTEYTVFIPDYLKYSFDVKPFVALTVTRNTQTAVVIFDTRETRLYNGHESLEISKWSGDAVATKWVANNVPCVKFEPFLNTPINYFTRVKFNLTEINIPQRGRERFSLSWGVLEKKLKNNPRFGKELNDDNAWLKKEVENIVGNLKDTLSTVNSIYKYVRDKFKCTGNSGIYLKYGNTLEDVFKNKEGNSTELNMLFIAMLRQLNFEANPLILSTKEHGFVNEVFPDIDDYNYLITKLSLTNADYYFDVSNPKLGFNKLPLNCYNENGRVITSGMSYNNSLVSDSIHENEKIFIYVSNDDNGISSATCKETMGYYHSYKFRDMFKEKEMDKIREYLEKSYSTSVAVKDLLVDSMKLYDYPVSINYSIDYNFSDDIVYFNPMMNQAITENPFKSANRRFPIEKPYTSSFNYSFTMEVPKGYSIDEMPKSSRVLLNEDEGLFEYKITASDNLIQLRCKLNFNKATYSADDYQTLRDFYAMVVKKMNEQIVFKKNKN